MRSSPRKWPVGYTPSALGRPQASSVRLKVNNRVDASSFALDIHTRARTIRKYWQERPTLVDTVRLKCKSSRRSLARTDSISRQIELSLFFDVTARLPIQFRNIF